MSDAQELAARLYREHSAFVWRNVVRMGVSEADGLDVVQEVFLRVLQDADRFDPARNPRPWVWGIAHNVLRDLWKKGRVALRHVTIDEAAMTRAPDRRAGSPEDLLVVQAGLRAIERDGDRLSFILFELEEYTVPEIAVWRGVSESKVKQDLKRARDEFRTALASTEPGAIDGKLSLSGMALLLSAERDRPDPTANARAALWERLRRAPEPPPLKGLPRLASGASRVWSTVRGSWGWTGFGAGLCVGAGALALVLPHVAEQPPAPAGLASMAASTPAPSSVPPPVGPTTPSPPGPPSAPEPVRAATHPVPPRRPVAPDAELTLIARTRTALLRSDAKAALGLLDEYFHRFPAGELAENGQALRVQALALAGRSAEAKIAADAFLEAHPNSIFRDAVLPASGRPTGERVNR